MKKILAISPHPDDESLGAAGTLLRHKDSGDELHWLIMTSTVGDPAYSEDFTKKRAAEIERTQDAYGFKSVSVLNFKPASLDSLPLSQIIGDVSAVFQSVQPNIAYLPYRGDAHSDHKIVFDAAIACTKSFRAPFLKSVRVYEALSETDFGNNPDANGFRPNYYVNIDKYLDEKIRILNIFGSEMKAPPFPRSEEAVRALALLRGQVAGTVAAEAFMSLKEVVDD